MNISNLENRDIDLKKQLSIAKAIHDETLNTVYLCLYVPVGLVGIMALINYYNPDDILKYLNLFSFLTITGNLLTYNLKELGKINDQIRHLEGDISNVGIELKSLKDDIQKSILQ